MAVRCNTSNVTARMLGIKGPQGEPGVPGATGADGLPGVDGLPGDDGLPGADGEDGLGVPAGGVIESVLTKASDIDNDTYWSESTLESSPWVVKTTNYVSINKDNIIADTTDATLSITLPNTSSIGWQA